MIMIMIMIVIYNLIPYTKRYDTIHGEQKGTQVCNLIAVQERGERILKKWSESVHRSVGWSVSVEWRKKAMPCKISKVR